MIIYDGLVKNGKVYFLKFKNDLGKSISIPIDNFNGKRISIYLEKFAKNDNTILERGNEEPEE